MTLEWRHRAETEVAHDPEKVFGFRKVLTTARAHHHTWLRLQGG